MEDLDVQIGALAQRQHGRFTLEDVRAIGGDIDDVKLRVRSGRWVAEHRGVYRVGGVPLTWEGRALAGCLTAGGEAMLSHLTAACLWFPAAFGPTGMVDVLVPRHLRPRRRSGIRYHESKVFELASPTVRRGVPVTGVARTIFDVCASVRDDTVALGALDEARRLGLVSWDELWTCYLLHRRRGRNGTRRFRRILERRWGKTVSHGRFARLFERLLDDAGLPELTHEHPVVVAGQPYRIDLCFPLWMIAIELDGGEGHRHEKAFEHDPIRNNQLVVEGWIVLHFTWQRFLEDPAGVVAEVLAAIKLRSGVR
ncbi:MAG: hypothetical protein QOJ67_3914 [Acidimicrobiaceae bacterium]|jgi:hypothetical protein